MKKLLVIVMAVTSIALMSFSNTKTHSLKENAKALLKDKNFVKLWTISMAHYNKIDMSGLAEFSQNRKKTDLNNSTESTKEQLLKVLGFASFDELVAYEKTLEELNNKIEKAHPEISNTLERELVASAVKLGVDQKIFTSSKKSLVLRNCEAEWAYAMSACFMIEIEFGYEAWAICMTIADANYMECVIFG
jgi:hypothetical protein